MVVDGADAVALPEPLRLTGGVVPELGDGGSADEVRRPQHDSHDDETRQQVHRGAGQDDDGPLPGRFAAEGSVDLTVSVLPFHGDIAADGQGAEGVLGLGFLFFPKDRTHAEGELIDTDLEQFRGQEVSPFVGGDQQSEEQDGRQNGPGLSPDEG